jgi:putative methionine-R-sulfoxide reductase with GAF domain
LKNGQFEDILIYFSKSLLGKDDETEILWDLAKNCISKLDFVDCVVYLIDHENKLLIQKAAYGPKNPKDKTLYKPVEISIGEGITGHVALTGTAEIVENTSNDPRYIKDDELRLSEICVPISYENTIYGVIDCEHPNEGFFNAQHLKMLTAIASICAIKIKSVRTTKTLLDEQERLYKIKEEMLGLKLKALNAQLNPHFVFNTLNAIQSLVISGERKVVMKYLSIFSKLLRFYLKNLERDVVTLMDEVDMLHWYLKLQSLRYDHRFEYSISVEQDPENGEAIIPCFPILTLLETIIEHAIYDENEKQELEIVFKVIDTKIMLEIDHKKANNKPIHYRDGYKERMANWEGQIPTNSLPIQISAKPPIDGPLTGSNKICLQLPNIQ